MDAMHIDQDFLKHQLNLFTKLLNDYMDRHKTLQEDVNQLKDAYTNVSEENKNVSEENIILKRQLEATVDAVTFNSQQLKLEMDNNRRLKRDLKTMKTEIEKVKTQKEDDAVDFRYLSERYHSMQEDKDRMEDEMNDVKVKLKRFGDWEEMEKKTEQLSQSVMDKNMDMVENLLRTGLSPNIKVDKETDKIPMIVHSVDTEQKELLELLIKYKADIDDTDKEYESSLHYSVYRQNLELVEILVNNYCKINCKNQFGRTPLHEAVAYDNMDIIKLLISKGADINLRDQIGETPLFKAIWYKKFENLQIIVNSGPELNIETYQGNTPLHIAALKGHPDIVKLLLSNGAKKNVTNFQNVSASNFTNNKSILKLLK